MAHQSQKTKPKLLYPAYEAHYGPLYTCILRQCSDFQILKFCFYSLYVQLFLPEISSSRYFSVFLKAFPNHPRGIKRSSCLCLQSNLTKQAAALASIYSMIYCPLFSKRLLRSSPVSILYCSISFPASHLLRESLFTFCI